MPHIDWMTIVGRREVDQKDWSVPAAYRTAAETLIDSGPTFIEAVGDPLGWQIVRPRAPYSFARRSADATRTLYVHPLASHFTLEISGQHCQRITHHMPALMRDFEEQFSRIDLAVDMETDITPLQFDQAIDAPRIKTRSRMSSSTGQTVYVGSRSSDKFARVYRYYEPHPRAHLLRAEFQLKHQYANGIASEIAAGVTLTSLAAGLGESFGFTHPCWQPDSQTTPLRVASHAQSGNTVSWLTTTVAPLLKRLQREGRLDVGEWFAQYVLAND